jgi:glycosyltransferase involved in cell wall biosynthesis
MSERAELMLSVRLMTYNHEAYIREAMDGIMMQKTDFAFEVVVGDDFSTDKTLEIIRRYIGKNDRIIIRILDRPVGGEYSIIRKEKGRLYNFSNIVENCKGKYIAILDGDDYWTDNKKLQKQVEFMEANPGCSICFHKANTLYKGRLAVHPVPQSPTGFYKYDELYTKHNFITTAAVVYRNFGTLPDWFHKLPYGDMGLYYMLARNGSIACLPEIMSVYRLHEKGIWHSKNLMDAYLEEFRFFEIIYPEITDDEVDRIEQKMRAVANTIAKAEYPRLFFMRPIRVRKLLSGLKVLRKSRVS